MDDNRPDANPTDGAGVLPDGKVLIGVMGPTGAGKSTFCNLFSESNFEVSDGLLSCTDKVQVSEPFMLDGREIVLIDTPGFDDTITAQGEIFRMITTFLAKTYAKGIKLSGILYFHKISDNRLGGIARQNFRLIRKLCGEEALQNMMIVTTMWGQVDPVAGHKREAELASKDIFFKPVISRGARMIRHDTTKESGEAIIQKLVDLRPKTLMIQQELVDERKPLNQTEAGRDLHTELELQAQRHQEELEGLRKELEELKGHYAQYRQEIDELKDAVAIARSKMEEAENEKQKLKEANVGHMMTKCEVEEKDDFDRTLLAFLWWLARR